MRLRELLGGLAALFVAVQVFGGGAVLKVAYAVVYGVVWMVALYCLYRGVLWVVEHIYIKRLAKVPYTPSKLPVKNGYQEFKKNPHVN